jgi:predicted dehydrogenase
MKGSDRVRVGVIGTGAMSQLMHLPILCERRDVEVVAVADADRPKAEAIAGRFGIPHVVDDEALIARSDVEAIVVCTPNHLHEAQAVAGLEAGKHVLVERPLALTAAGARRVLDAAERSGRKLNVGLYHRFRPDVSALRAFVAGGELGELHAIRGVRLNRKVPLARTTWRQRPEEAGGGALMDLGVQALDLCLWMVGCPEIARVTANMAAGDFEVEESATLVAETREGLSVSLEVSWSYFGDADYRRIRVMGHEGSGLLPPLSVHKQLGGRPLDVTPRQPKPRGGEDPYTNSYRRALDHFVRCIVGQAEAPLPQEQVHLMEVIEAAYRSAREGREVALGDG